MSLPLLGGGSGHGSGGGGGGGSWTPATLTTVKLWLQADTISGTTGDLITTWTDISGNGNDATAAGGLRPTLQTAHQNGLNTIRFTATSPSSMGLPNVFSAFTEAAVAFVMRCVSDPGVSSKNATLVQLGDDASVSNHYPFTDGSIYTTFACSARKTVGNPTPSLANYHLGGFRSKASDWRYHLNGTEFFQTSTNTVSITTSPQLGQKAADGNYMDGWVGEIVLLNEFASTSDWNKLEGYLAWKWGLVSDLDAGHPYKAAPP